MSPIWYIHTWILEEYETYEVDAIRLDSQEGCQTFVIHPKEINHTVSMIKLWLHEPEVSNNNNLNYNSYYCSLPARGYMVTLIRQLTATNMPVCEPYQRAIYLSNFLVMCSYFNFVTGNFLSEYH